MTSLRKLWQTLGIRDLAFYRKQFNPDKRASQRGEDGIIAEIFRRLGVEQGWFVEFGAYDGVTNSNTYALAQRGWSGVYIEANPRAVQSLQENIAGNQKLHAICEFVNLEGESSLEALLARTPLPEDFELISIDVDGNDYWIWESLRRYRPQVVVIEYNPNFEPGECKTIRYDRAHQWDHTMYYGASAGALAKLGRAKGYTLVGFTPQVNLFFVRDDLAAGRFRPLKMSRLRKRPLHIQRRAEEFVEV